MDVWIAFTGSLKVDVKLHPDTWRDAVAPDVVLESLPLCVCDMELDVVVMTALALHEAIVGCFPSNHGTWASTLLSFCKLGTVRPPEG